MAIGTSGTFEVLGALDRAKTQWYHFTTIIIAGMGFFTGKRTIHPLRRAGPSDAASSSSDGILPMDHECRKEFVHIDLILVPLLCFHRCLRPFLHFHRHQAVGSPLLLRPELCQARRTATQRVRRSQRCGIVWDAVRTALLWMAGGQGWAKESLWLDFAANDRHVHCFRTLLWSFSKRSHEHPLLFQARNYGSAADA